MDDAISQSGFTVVDMGNDGKITDVLHLAARNLGWIRERMTLWTCTGTTKKGTNVPS
jgi:hypothetical protein